MSNLTPRHRLLRLLRFLREQGRVSTASAARHLRVTKEVARDDLGVLAQEGFARQVGEGRDTDWMVDPLDATVIADLYDALALRIGREHCDFLKDTPLHATLERAERGTRDRLGAHLPRLAQKVVCLHEPARSYEGQEDVVDELIEGLLGERRLRLRYRGELHDELEPLTLVIYRRALYLLARRVNDWRVLRLAVDRMSEVSAGERFAWPEDWDPHAALEPWFGIFAHGAISDVVLRFDADRAALVRARTWHRSARVVELDDGRVELHMQSGGPELARFVLEWGPTVEVVAPAELRDEVTRQLRAALDRYERTASKG